MEPTAIPYTQYENDFQRWSDIFKQIDSVTKSSHHPPAKFEKPTTIRKDQEHVLRND